MSAISETYNRGHNILELADFCQIFISQQNKGNVIITNKNGKYELTDVLPKNARKSPWNYSLEPRLFPKFKILSILARNY